MPTVYGTDLFAHGNFAVPGGGPYSDVDSAGGTPAMDISVVRPGDPASLRLSTGADLGYQLDLLPVRGWRGFAWRINASDEPGSNQVIAQMWTVGFGHAAKLYYIPSTNELSHTVDDVGFSNIGISLNTWIWIEQIFDVSTTTFSIYTRVNGVDMTPQTNTSTASTVQYVEFGHQQNIARWSRSMWGSAATITDWFGEPGGESLTTDPSFGIGGRGAGW